MNATRKIYKIINILSNKIYIGKTIKPLEVRLHEHITTAKRWLKETETNTPHPYESRLYPAMNKYGYDNFKISLVEVLLDDSIFSLEEREQYWISYYNSTDPNIGYNISPGGLGGPLFLGHHHSEAMKQEASIRSRRNILLDANSIKKRKLPCTNKFQSLLTGELFYSTELIPKPVLYKQTLTHLKIYRHTGTFFVCLGQRRNEQSALTDLDRIDLNNKLVQQFEQNKLNTVEAMHAKLQILRTTIDYQQKHKEAAKTAATLRQQKYWENFICEQNLDIEEYKLNYHKYKDNCPNQHLALIYNLSVTKVRGLNKYLGLKGGKSGHKHGKVSIEENSTSR